MIPQPPSTTLFPYTTLFRSLDRLAHARPEHELARTLDEHRRFRARRPGVGDECECALGGGRSEEHTSELQSLAYLVCRLLLEKKKSEQSVGMVTTTGLDIRV